MVDIVVNNIPALAVNTSLSTSALQSVGSRWTDPSQFHPQCWIDYNNNTSVEYWYVVSRLPETRVVLTAKAGSVTTSFLLWM